MCGSGDGEVGCTPGGVAVVRHIILRVRGSLVKGMGAWEGVGGRAGISIRRPRLPGSGERRRRRGGALEIRVVGGEVDGWAGGGEGVGVLEDLGGDALLNGVEGRLGRAVGSAGRRDRPCPRAGAYKTRISVCIGGILFLLLRICPTLEDRLRRPMRSSRTGGDAPRACAGFDRNLYQLRVVRCV